MKTLYLDLASGISGDMFVGALLDLGADAGQLERALARLKLGGYHLHAGRGQRGAIAGVKFEVHLETDSAPDAPAGPAHAAPPGDPEHEHGHAHHPHDHPHAHTHAHAHPPTATATVAAHGRTFADIKQLLQDSPFTHWVKHKAIAVFQRVAAAEGKVHGLPPEQVHFHEVGAVDSIVDIVGACLALEQLGQPRVLASAVMDGTGWIQCAHGRLPIPAPATLEILSARNVPLTQCDEPFELVTPTGAALLAEFAESFGPLRDFVPAKVGYGLGSRELRTRSNALRVVLGEPLPPNPDWERVLSPGHCDWETDTIATLQTNLDDTPAEILGRFVELALARGALDVFFTPIQMKKNRPATLLTVLCAEGDADKFSELILRETSAFGVRRSLTERRKLRREIVVATTAFGEVAVKLGRLNGRVVQVAPEFEACQRAAEQAGVPLKQVYDAALRAVKPE